MIGIVAIIFTPFDWGFMEMLSTVMSEMFSLIANEITLLYRDMVQGNAA